MKASLETNEVLAKHAEMMAVNRARLIDGYCQLYIRKCPYWLPRCVYRFVLAKVLVLAFFKEK